MAAIYESSPSSQTRALGISLIVSQILEAIENEDEESQKNIGGSIWYFYPSSRREKNDTLAACARVNRLWHGETIKLLYRTLPIPLYSERKKIVSDQDRRDDEFDEVDRKRRYDNLLHRLPRKRRQFIASQIHTLELYVSPLFAGRHRLIYAEMLSRLEFPRLRRLMLEGAPDPLLGLPVLTEATEMAATVESQQSSSLVRRPSELEAFKAIFSSPNLVHLDLSERHALSYALQLERQSSSILINLLSRLTTLSLRVYEGDDPKKLSVLQHCKQLERLELFDVAETFPMMDTFATTMNTVFTNSPSLEVLRIGRSEEKSYTSKTRSAWDHFKPPCPRLRELDFTGPAHLADLLLEHIDPSIMETLSLQLCVKAAEAINLHHLASRGYPKLKRLSITRTPATHWVSGKRDIDLDIWIIPPKKLLSVLEGTPNLTHLTIDTVVEEDGTWPYHLIIDIDDHFLSKMGALLPRLEHLDIKNNPYGAAWDSAGFIALGRSCRYLTHFDVGGHMDITDPVFEDTLRKFGLLVNVGEQVEPGPEPVSMSAQSRAVTNVPPLFPCLRNLAITSLRPRLELSDEYPAEMYRRAPPKTVARLHCLLATHFPYLISLSRLETDSQLQMELRRKYDTWSWPTNRLSYFASPWYERLKRDEVMWKFETRRRSKKDVESRDSDSNSNIDSEDGQGAYESDSLFKEDDSDDDHDEKQRFGGALRISLDRVPTARSTS